MDIHTGILDKFGKPIHIGDIVQHRLSLNSKHGGAHNYQVARDGNKIRLIQPGDPSKHPIGATLDKTNARFCVVIDHLHDPV